LYTILNVSFPSGCT